MKRHPAIPEERWTEVQRRLDAIERDQESPILYRRDAGVLKQLRAFADRMLHPRALTYHYLHLARRQAAAKLARERIVLKRYFYALRPALAVRFLRLKRGQRPPMNLQALMEGMDLPAATIKVIAQLVAAKSQTRELGSGPRIPTLDRLIASEIAAAAGSVADAPGRPATDLERADRLLRRLIRA